MSKKIIIDELCNDFDGSVVDYLSTNICGTAWGTGQLEDCTNNISDVENALIRLCDILVDKNILTAEDITMIAQGYSPNNVGFFTNESD